LPNFSSDAIFGKTAFAPQRGQCLLPENITPKHDGQAIVLSRERQN
jgi:hypothetical protein